MFLAWNKCPNVNEPVQVQVSDTCTWGKIESDKQRSREK